MNIYDRIHAEKNRRNWYVEIVDTDADTVVKSIGPMSERDADRVDAGANVNLNHDQYHTRVVQK